MVRIKAVEILEGLRVRLELTDGKIVERDLSDLLMGPPFAQVRENRNVFEEVRVDGGTLVWPGGIDLCPDMIIYGGAPPQVADAERRIA